MAAPPLLVRDKDGIVRWGAPTHDAGSAAAGSHAGSSLGSPGYAPSAFDAECDAVYLLARAKLQRWGVDASRRCLEAAPRATELRYYERWCFAVTTLLIETGVLTNEEVEGRLAALRGSSKPRDAAFADGAPVRVLCDNPAARWRTPHLRAPRYAQGKCGTVERCVGAFDAPEERAYLTAAVSERLYRVAFRHVDLFPDAAAGAASEDAVVVELFERWLEDATTPQTAAQRSNAGSVYEALLAVVKALLIEKGILTQAEIDAHVATQAAMLQQGAALGGRLVAAAWCDPAFRERLLSDAHAAASELGVSTAGIARLIVLPCSAEVHHLVVCTLCSCYPRPILGPPPDWYRSWQYRQRAVTEPRKVLDEWGVHLPPGTRVEVHDSTADCRYLVLPARPAGTEGWTEAQLAAIVTTESLVGVAVCVAGAPKAFLRD